MSNARVCHRCEQTFASRKGCNRYCVPCGPVASKARQALYLSEHREAARLYGIAYRAGQRRPGPVGRLLRCWCGNLFMPRTSRHKHCTNDCARRAWRNKLKGTTPIVVPPAPTLPPVDYNLILTEMLATARRARARIEAEAELAASAYREKQERLAGILACILEPALPFSETSETNEQYK